MKKLLLITAILFSFIQTGCAMETSVPSVTPQEAVKMQQQGMLLIDVRTRPEFELIGHPKGAVNIPYKTYPSWQVDPGFEKRVLALSHGQKVLIICRSGKRSMAASTLLRKAGVEAINIVEGFEGPKDSSGHRNTDKGWRNHNLPWGY